MADVARLSGVSIKTVSNVLNNYPHIRDTTRARVLAVVDELGYEVNAAARSLRSGRTGMIGLAVPELGQPYFGELADEILAAARQSGVQVLIEPTGYSREGELAALREPKRGLVDGLIFSPAVLAQDDIGLFESVDFPLVLLGEQIFSPAIDHVSMHNVKGARTATELMLEHGRRHIAIIGLLHKEAGASSLRLQGYREALESRGIAVDERLMGWADDGWHRSNGARAMAQVLDSGAHVDAVFALNDALALGAMYEVQSRGHTVPEDIAVIGFDDIEDAPFAKPALTTIDPGRREIAERAVELLCRRIDERVAGKGEVDEPVLHLADLKLVERGSTAPLRR